jgi:hypothetical protein
MYDFSNLFKLRAELTEAIGNNDLTTIKKLLSNEENTIKNLNYLDKDGQSPLHTSCISGNFEICKLLVEKGATQCLKNKDGWYPIHLASYYGNVKVVQYLLDEKNFRSESILPVYDEFPIIKVDKTVPKSRIYNYSSYRSSSVDLDDSNSSISDSSSDCESEDSDDDDYEDENHNSENDSNQTENPNNNEDEFCLFNDKDLLSLDLKGLDILRFNDVLDLNNLELTAEDFLF